MPVQGIAVPAARAMATAYNHAACACSRFFSVLWAVTTLATLDASLKLGCLLNPNCSVRSSQQ
eukprot:18728-Heterococcus_DN1.PRE.2